MARDKFAFMRHMVTWPPLEAALRQVFRGEPYRYASHNDIGINRIVSWHKDRLNDAYRKYQRLPLWGNQTGGGHKIVKACVYLQSHEHDDGGLMIVPDSYMNPSLEERRGAHHVHNRKGSVVIFEQRSTHRGLSILEGMTHAMMRRPDRILISLGYGLRNAYTDEFAAGTRARQADQCGTKCTRRQAHSKARAAGAAKGRR
jgi:hypothetical protein